LSGIFGIFRFDDAPVLAEDLGRMSEAMAFYGTDGGGIWREDASVPRVGLGCRLRHVTPEDALETQPLVRVGGALVAAGRLDNREELAEALRISQNEASQLSDSALILGAHQKWGDACVDHLVGDWSFAVWDGIAQRLLVARDHHGNTGIYWHQDRHRVAFATSLKALLALPDIPKRPDLFKMAQILSAWPGDGIRTSYEDIQSLPPAHILKVSRTGTEPRRYWFPEAAEPLTLVRDEDYLEQFLEIYGKAVQARLRSAKPVGATLSAGLDSGSVVALAGPLLAARGQALEAFTAVPLFDDPTCLPAPILGNEWELAHATALMAGVEAHFPVNASGIGILESLHRQVAIHDGPGNSGANYHWMLALLEQARERGLGVLLTGQQGNATVSHSGEGSLWWPNLLKGHVGEAWDALRNAESNPWLGFKRHVLKPILMPGLHAYRRHCKGQGRPWIRETALAPALARELDLEASMAHAGFDPTFETEPRPMNLALLGLGHTDVGAIWHELGAEFGLEVRDPTADRRVIEFCLRVPEAQFRLHGQDRLLLRRAMAGRMPPEVLQTTLRGRQAADLGHRVLAARPSLEQPLEALALNPLAAHCLDLHHMADILDRLSPGNAQAAYDDCGCILLRGLNIGLFLDRFQEVQSMNGPVAIPD
jgi:asparagine synthase (glutamine-hydrolysing)